MITCFEKRLAEILTAVKLNDPDKLKSAINKMPKSLETLEDWKKYKYICSIPVSQLTVELLMEVM